MSTLIKTVKLALVVASSLSLMSVSIIAQDLPVRGPIPFSSYDTNNDGFISEGEFNEAKAARMSKKTAQGMPMRNAVNAPEFSTLDTNSDGKLTKIELLEGQNQQMQKNRGNRGNRTNQ